MDVKSPPALERWPVAFDVPVAWGEMDAFQHVNNTVYLRWCESARIAYFEQTGLLSQMKEKAIGPILARVAVDYRAPVTYPDTIRVETTVTKMGNTSFTMKCRMRRAQALSVLVAEAETVVVLINYRTGEKVALDSAFKDAVLGLEAKGSN
jgi:acyl-CoA thioester hydrolase